MQSRQWNRFITDLVRSEDELILLFTPPFQRTARDPGYIKGYPPGIRENGGQYTHAALWAIWAFAQLGQDDRATELFRLINPIYHADTPEKVRSLSGGALCHRRGCVQRRTVYRARRLDVVQRLGKLDVSSGH